MSLTTSEMTPADIAAVTNNGYNDRNGGWGGEWSAWIIIFLIFGMFGWGGFGGFGGFGGNAGASGALTRADLCQDMNFQQLENGVRGIQQGLCDGFYAMNTSMLNGFHGVDNAVCQLGYQTQQGFNSANVVALQNHNALQAQISDCCCKNQTGQMQIANQVERGFCDTNYNAATNTNAIIQNAHNDTDRVLAKLDAMEMARKDETIFALREKLSQADLRASQADQNNYLVNTLRPCPIPAYQTCNPWASQSAYGSCGNYGGCGCNG